MTWHSRQLQHTACSVEACPHPRLGNLVAVASYELVPDTGARLGQVALGAAGPGPEHRHHSALACAGVLDMKWRHGGDSDPVLSARCPCSVFTRTRRWSPSPPGCAWRWSGAGWSTGSP